MRAGEEFRHGVAAVIDQGFVQPAEAGGGIGGQIFDVQTLDHVDHEIRARDAPDARQVLRCSGLGRRNAHAGRQSGGRTRSGGRRILRRGARAQRHGAGGPRDRYARQELAPVHPVLRRAPWGRSKSSWASSPDGLRRPHAAQHLKFKQRIAGHTIAPTACGEGVWGSSAVNLPRRHTRAIRTLHSGGVTTGYDERCNARGAGLLSHKKKRRHRRRRNNSSPQREHCGALCKASPRGPAPIAGRLVRLGRYIVAASSGRMCPTANARSRPSLSACDASMPRSANHRSRDGPELR